VDSVAQKTVNAVGACFPRPVFWRDRAMGYAMAPPVPKSLAQSVEVQSSSVEGATGATLGELFEYNFAKPITIKKNQSAMLLSCRIKSPRGKLADLYRRDGEHPVNAAEVINNTAKTLDGGPSPSRCGRLRPEKLCSRL